MNFTEGQFLYAPIWTTTTYLRKPDGSLNHSWTGDFFPGLAVLWLGDGTILRTIRTGDGAGAGGSGGGVQKVEWDGTVVWDFRYNTDGNLTHHDVKILPNGNVLLIAWETKTRDEAITAGRNPSYAPSQGVWSDHIIEVQPTGPTTGVIVWEWHAWDHLIQDYDASKTNYGSVGDHPELIDVNYGAIGQIDWLHTNSLDYNETLDQILLSIHNFNEIWIIDHSTTTAEAAGHSGGHNGKGGDLLFRWGNPAAYRRGTLNDKKLFSQHDASWIDSGCPGAGDILIFNNGVNRLDGLRYSSVDEIVPPVNANGEYYLAPASAYGPTTQKWIYTASPPTSFYARHLSGAWRLPTGNTLITDGETGKVFEVTPEGTTVWHFDTGGQVFKVVYIPPNQSQPPNPNTPDLDCSGSLSWTKIKPNATVRGSFQLQNIGGATSLLNWTVNTSTITWGTWTITPETGMNLTPAQGLLTIDVSVIAPNESNTAFEGYLRVENINDATDFELVPVLLKTPFSYHSLLWIYLSTLFSYFLHHHIFLQQLWETRS